MIADRRIGVGAYGRASATHGSAGPVMTGLAGQRCVIAELLARKEVLPALDRPRYPMLGKCC